MDHNKLHYLRRLGIDVYQTRPSPPEAMAAPSAQTATPPTAANSGQNTTNSAPPPPSQEQPPPPTHEYAPSLAIQDQQQPPESTDNAGQNTAQDRANAIAQLDWQTLQTQVNHCTACALAEQRQHSVFGSGDPKAKLLIIGEAPGRDEDRQGQPFVGRAGQLLDAMLKAIGLQREHIYITNTLKCRPPNNRDPKADEIQTCAPYLQRQIQLIDPQIILCLGRHAAHSLLERKDSIGRLRANQQLTINQGNKSYPVLVSYHPAYLLRSPSEKAKSWQDLCTLRQRLSQT